MSSHHSVQKWVLAAPALVGAGELAYWYWQGLELNTPLGVAVGFWLVLLVFQGWEKWRFMYRVRAQRGIRYWQHAHWIFAFMVFFPSLHALSPLAVGRWFGWLPPGFGLQWGPWVWLAGMLVGPVVFLLLKPFEAPPRLREISLKAPAGRGALRLLFLSDLHLGNLTPEGHLEWVLELVRQRRPDAVLFGGDLVDHDLDQLERHQAWFESIAALAPTYAVMGNHDYMSGQKRFSVLLKDWGVRLLRDAQAELPGGWPLLGLRDLDFEGLELGVLNALPLEQAPALVISHHPDLFKQLDPSLREKVWLGFSGHTHGGQIVLPFLGALLHPADRRFKPGLTHLEGLPPVITNPGLGYTLIPLRFGSPPEAIWVEIN